MVRQFLQAHRLLSRVSAFLCVNAFLDADRNLKVQPRENGQNVGRPISLRFLGQDVQDGRTQRVEIVSLQRKPQPAMQPKEVVMGGQMEDKIRFEMEIGFTEDSITMEGELHLGSVRRKNVYLSYGAFFPGSHQLPPNSAESVIQSATAGAKLILCLLL